MIEIIILVCVIIVIWKWSDIKSYLTPVLSLDKSLQNSSIAYDNATKNVQQLYTLQDSVSQQINASLDTKDKTIYSQQLTVQTTTDAANAVQKLADKLDPTNTNTLIPEIQYAINLINKVNQVAAQSTAQIEVDEKIKNDQINSMQAITDLLPNTKATVSDLDEQINESTKSITKALDKVTNEANAIINTGTAIQNQVNIIIQILSSANAQGKILASEFRSAMGVLSQVYESLNLSYIQSNVIHYLLVKNSVIPDSFKNVIPEQTLLAIDKINTINNENMKAISDLTSNIKSAFDIDINAKLLALDEVLSMSVKGINYQQTSFDKMFGILEFIDGLINPVQTAILSANRLQAIASITFQKVIFTSNQLLSSSMNKNQYLDKFKTNMADFTNNLKKAITAQQKVNNDTDALVKLQQPLQNAILAKQSAPNTNLQNIAQVVVQKLSNQLQSLFKNIAGNLTVAGEAQNEVLLSLKTLSENNASNMPVFGNSDDKLLELNNIIDKSKMDTQNAINQANAVQSFIDVFVHKLKRDNLDIKTLIDFTNSTQNTIDSVFPAIEKVGDLTGNALINAQKISKDVATSLTTLLNIISLTTAPITGVDVFYNYDNNGVATVDIITKTDTGSIKVGNVFPYVDLMPDNLKVFLSSYNTKVETPPVATIIDAPMATIVSHTPLPTLTDTSVANISSFTNRGYGFTRGKKNIINLTDDEFNPGYYQDNYLFGLESSMNY
jgi:hypothetical protein